MKKTTNLKLSLYEAEDKFAITSSDNSLNRNMELIDNAIVEKATIADLEAAFIKGKISGSMIRIDDAANDGSAITVRVEFPPFVWNTCDSSDGWFWDKVTVNTLTRVEGSGSLKFTSGERGIWRVGFERSGTQIRTDSFNALRFELYSSHTSGTFNPWAKVNNRYLRIKAHSDFNWAVLHEWDMANIALSPGWNTITLMFSDGVVNNPTLNDSLGAYRFELECGRGDAPESGSPGNAYTDYYIDNIRFVRLGDEAFDDVEVNQWYPDASGKKHVISTIPVDKDGIANGFTSVRNVMMFDTKYSYSHVPQLITCEYRKDSTLTIEKLIKRVSDLETALVNNI